MKLYNNRYITTQLVKQLHQVGFEDRYVAVQFFFKPFVSFTSCAFTLQDSGFTLQFLLQIYCLFTNATTKRNGTTALASYYDNVQ